MKQLSRRIARLETKRETPSEWREEYDWSRISVDQAWKDEICAQYEGSDGKFNIEAMTIPELRRLEWILGRCSIGSAGYGHQSSCRCHYCVPLDERLRCLPKLGVAL